jgi:hypothetical protein
LDRTASVPQIRGILDNPQNQVKPAEVKWSGIKDWLTPQKGAISKQEASTS